MVGGLQSDVESDRGGDETDGEGEAEVVFGAEEEDEEKKEDVDLVLTQAPPPARRKVKREEVGEVGVQGLFGQNGYV